MAARKAPRRKTTAANPPPCQDGQTTEANRVGHARRPRVTADQQTGLCLTCWGTGEDPNPAKETAHDAPRQGV